MKKIGSTIILKKGTDLELTIESLAFGGMGVSRIEDMIVFVKNAIPEQTVMARITKKRSSGNPETESKKMIIKSRQRTIYNKQKELSNNCGLSS